MTFHFSTEERAKMELKCKLIITDKNDRSLISSNNSYRLKQYVLHLFNSKTFTNDMETYSFFCSVEEENAEVWLWLTYEVYKERAEFTELIERLYRYMGEAGTL